MKQLIPIISTGLGANSVDARTLWKQLESKQDFSTWIKAKVVDNPFFMENQDYVLLHNSVEQTGRGGHNRKDYALTIDTAKKVAMSEQTEMGSKVQDYFLECEKVAQSPVDPMKALNDPAVMRGLLLSYTEKVTSLESTVKEQAPKVAALDRISTADGLTCITDTAKSLQIRPKDLFAWLSGNGWIYRRAGGKGWLAYQNRIQQGVLSHKVTTIETSDGREKIIESVKVTPKGLAKLAGVFPEASA